ncbi:MAG: hypothetical protein K6G29_00655 [Clostridiales bacterium]|nr:hypothetical protein [Clostridiales bacterium]
MQRKLYVFENLDLDINGSSFLFIVWGICAGILLGVLLSLIYRVYAHKLVAALAEHGACDRESAKTLAELGFPKNRVIRHMLGEGGSMTSIVSCANEDEFPPRKISKLRHFWHYTFLRGDPLPPKTDFSVARFYLPEEKRITAEVRFPAEKHPVRNFLLAALGLSAVAFFIVLALPELLVMFDNLVSQVKPMTRRFY